MLTVTEFIEKYKTYTDEELYEIYSAKEEYSDDARSALEKVLEMRGGVDHFLNKMSNIEKIEEERIRVRNEVTKLCSDETNPEFIKKMVTSDLLPREEVEGIIEMRFKEYVAFKADRKVDSGTIGKVAIGTTVASLVGGVLWGIQAILSQRVFYILIFGLLILCFGIVKMFAKKSTNNLVVMIGSVLAVVLSVLIGEILFNIIGYIE